MKKEKTDVLIIGAGPVGLWTAALLAEAGIDLQIIDREERTASRSYACALHPATLALLEKAGLAAPLLKHGCCVRTMAFYEGAERRAEVDLSKADPKFPFVLVVPQNLLEQTFERWLRLKPQIKVQWNHRFDGLENEPEKALATVERLGGTGTGYIVPHWETIVLELTQIQSRFIVAADGHNSLVRRRLGIESESFGPAESFAAIEFTSDLETTDEVRVVLNDNTVNVLWPLPDNRFRWTFQLTRSNNHTDFPEKERLGTRFTGRGMDEDLRRWVQSTSRRRAPWFKGSIKEITWCTQVAFQPSLAKQFGTGRCWLVGDAAHQTGPVGAQSMNVGLHEAQDLAGTLQKIMREEAPISALEAYERERKGEWKQLLGLSGGLKPSAKTDAWVRSHVTKMLSCLPGSGAELKSLAEQLGLQIA